MEVNDRIVKMTRSIVTTSTLQVEDSISHKEWKKYSTYDVEVDEEQDDKSTEIKLCSCVRPHMRNFHAAWLAFFISFFVWFAVTPLLPEIQKTLHLSKQQIWDSSIASVAGTIVIRVIIGPICDMYGPKIPMVIILWIATITTASLGFVESAVGLIVLRTFIGFTGAAFVMCMLWSSITFTKEVSGSSNGFAGGWGNLGAGVSQIVMGTVLFPLFKYIFNNDAEMAWRSVCVVPALIAFGTGLWILCYSDDTPKGNYSELQQHNKMQVESYHTLLRFANYNINTWIFFIQYATCFGVEISLNNAIGLYFTEEFGQSTESAAALAAIFGWLNLFARGFGGVLSDYCHFKYGMQGRISIHTVLLLMEGVMVLVFAQTKTIGLAILTLVIFSFFVQAAEGSLFGIVPYIDYPRTGSITGMIGAGGNVGAVLFGIAFRQYSYETTFIIMGISIIASCFLSLFVNIPGQTKLMMNNISGGCHRKPVIAPIEP